MVITDRSKRSSGFTLIELLIVIIIIGILSLIAYVSISASLRKARNVRTLSGVRQYYDALADYDAVNGAWPKTPNEGVNNIAMVCLGHGYPGGTCGKISGTQIYESTSFNTMVTAAISGSVNDIVNNVPGTVKNENFIGAAYGIDKVDQSRFHTQYGRVIEWFLEGENQKCLLPNSWAYNSGNGNTACEIFIEPYTQP